MIDKDNGFCALPFVQYSTYNGGRYRLCCMAKEPQDVGHETVNQHELGIDGTWNHEYIKDVRKRMVQGEWLPECVECERLERNGIGSSRNWENKVWEPVIDDIVETASVYEWTVDQPLQFDFRLGNLCNLACQMCNKEASHLVSVERAEMANAGYTINHHDWENNIADKKKALLQPGIDWASFEKMIGKVRKIKMIGGEPTVAPDMFKLLDIATETGHAEHIELSFFTNITNMQDKWLEQLSKFERVIVNCSLEGVGDMNDYLRPPSNWDSVWDKFTKLVDFANTPKGKRIRVRVSTVNTITNALHMVPLWRKLHDYIVDNNYRGIGISTNQLVEPRYYSMAYSPQWMRDEQERQILGFLDEIKDSRLYEDYEEHLMDIVNFGKDPEHQYDANEMRMYVKVTETYDKWRNVSVHDVCPEFQRIKDEL